MTRQFIYNGPTSEEGHVLRYWGLGRQHTDLRGGYYSSRNKFPTALLCSPPKEVCEAVTQDFRREDYTSNLDMCCGIRWLSLQSDTSGKNRSVGGEKITHHRKTTTQTSWSISLETHFPARVSAFDEVVALNWASKCSW